MNPFNIIKNNLKFAKKIIKKKGSLPIYMIFEPTSLCNARCSFCYNWQTVEDKKNELSLDEIDRFTRSMDSKLLALALSGGEPFLREDLPEVINIFNKNTAMNHLSIPTNALLPDRIFETVTKILDVYKKRFVVLLSLDGIGKDHDKIRGIDGIFEKVVETYNKLSRIQSDHFEISITTCLSSLNMDKYLKIYNYVRKHFPGLSTHNFSFMRSRPPDETVKPPDQQFFQENKKKLQEITLDNKGYQFDILGFFHSTKARYYDIACKTNKDKKRDWPCYAGQLTAYVDCYGDVWPCEIYKKFGNLKNADFRDIWFSETAEKVRSEIKNKNCWCDHGCFVYINILFNPIEYFKLLRYVKR